MADCLVEKRDHVLIVTMNRPEARRREHRHDGLRNHRHVQQHPVARHDSHVGALQRHTRLLKRRSIHRNMGPPIAAVSTPSGSSAG